MNKKAKEFETSKPFHKWTRKRSGAPLIQKFRPDYEIAK
jgi:hypothetical protein